MTRPSLLRILPTDHCIALCTSPPQQNYNGYAPPPQPGYGYQSSPQPYGFNGGVRTTYLTPALLSPNPPPSHQAARHRITSPPIADRARVPQPPPPQQYGYNAPPQGQYGRPSEQLSSPAEHTGTSPLGRRPLSNRMLATQTHRTRTRVTAMLLAHPQPPHSTLAPAPPPTMLSSTRSAMGAGRPCSLASTTSASAAS